MRKAVMILALITSAVFLAMASSGKEMFTRCQGCHGADGSRHALGIAPLLKGQSKDEIVKKLKGYQSGTYGGARKTIMEAQAKRLSDDQINTLAGYISKF
jgi:cytochrome c